MYFLIDGEAQVISDDGSTVYAELKPSSFFGEVALFYEVARTATVRASAKATMFELDKSDLGEVLEQHPQLRDTMKRTAEENWLLFQKRQKGVEKLVEEKDEQGAEEGKFDILATAERLKKVNLSVLSSQKRPLCWKWRKPNLATAAEYEALIYHHIRSRSSKRPAKDLPGP